MNEGYLIPDWGMDYAKFSVGTGWATSNEYYKNNGGCTTDGGGCFAKIMEDGWKMNY